MSSGEQEALRLATRARRIEKVLSANETVPTNSVIEFMIDADNELRRLLAEREADRAVMREALEALEIGNEAAQAIALDMRITYAGYMNRKQREADDDVEKIAAAISSLKARTK